MLLDVSIYGQKFTVSRICWEVAEGGEHLLCENCQFLEHEITSRHEILSFTRRNHCQISYTRVHLVYKWRYIGINDQCHSCYSRRMKITTFCTHVLMCLLYADLVPWSGTRLHAHDLVVFLCVLGDPHRLQMGDQLVVHQQPAVWEDELDDGGRY